MILTLKDGETEVDIEKLINIVNKSKTKKIKIPMSSFALMPVNGTWPDTKGNYWRLIDILNYRNKNKFFKDHYKRIVNADVKYPILLDGNKEDFDVVDGFHRISKQILNDEPFIEGVFLTPTQIKKAKPD